MALKTLRLLAAVFGSLAVMLVLRWSVPVSRASSDVVPRQAAAVRFVSPTGKDASPCTSSAEPCMTVQYAVDQAADGDEIRVAEGLYAGVQARAGITQTLYVTKTVSIYAGWDASFGAWDPQNHPTTLDAGGQGRGVVISGTVAPTLAGLRVTHGNSDLYGGGVYALGANPVITACTVFSNNAAYGGGIYLEGGVGQVVNTAVLSNTATWQGGGFFLATSAAQVRGGRVSGNRAATGGGGGLYLQNSQSSLIGTAVTGNHAEPAEGGGLYLMNSRASVTGASIGSNTARFGGGLYVNGNAPTIQGNSIVDNIATGVGAATGSGGGLYLSVTNASVLSNTLRGNQAAVSEGRGGGIYADRGAPAIESNVVTLNAAGGYGGGAFFDNAGGALASNQITANTAGYDGGGLHVYGSGSLTISQNAVLSNTAGILGGGLYVSASNLQLNGNTIAGNTVTNVTNGYGGGLYYQGAGTYGPLVGVGNVFRANVVVNGPGGGIFLYGGVAQFDRTTVQSNLANGNGGAGGGLYLDATQASFTNVLIADNSASSLGSGVYVDGAAARFAHTTLVRNTGADGSGLRAGPRFATLSTVYMTNTIVAGQAGVGVAAASGDKVSLVETLWGTGGWANGADTGGPVTTTGDYHGGPRFRAPAAGDYHLTALSAAIDRGLPVGVLTDLDGLPRPNPNTGIADLGAYEWEGRVPARLYLPMLKR